MEFKNYAIGASLIMLVMALFAMLAPQPMEEPSIVPDIKIKNITVQLLDRSRDGVLQVEKNSKAQEYEAVLAQNTWQTNPTSGYLTLMIRNDGPDRQIPSADKLRAFAIRHRKGHPFACYP